MEISLDMNKIKKNKKIRHNIKGIIDTLEVENLTGHVPPLFVLQNQDRASHVGHGHASGFVPCACPIHDRHDGTP